MIDILSLLTNLYTLCSILFVAIGGFLLSLVEIVLILPSNVAAKVKKALARIAIAICRLIIHVLDNVVPKVLNSCTVPSPVEYEISCLLDEVVRILREKEKSYTEIGK